MSLVSIYVSNIILSLMRVYASTVTLSLVRIYICNINLSMVRNLCKQYYIMHGESLSKQHYIILGESLYKQHYIICGENLNNITLSLVRVYVSKVTLFPITLSHIEMFMFAALLYIIMRLPEHIYVWLMFGWWNRVEWHPTIKQLNICYSVIYVVSWHLWCCKPGPVMSKFAKHNIAVWYFYHPWTAKERLPISLLYWKHKADLAIH